MMQKKIRWAGQPQHILDLATGLRERGHEVILISQTGSDFVARARASGFEVHEISMTSLPVQVWAGFRLAWLLRRLRIDLLHCHDTRDHQIAIFSQRAAGVRTLLRTKHNLNPLRNAASRWVHGPMTSHLLAVSEAVRQKLLASGMPPDHVTVVHNWVEPARVRPETPPAELKRALGIPEDAPVVGTLGRLHRVKGIGDLVRALPTVLAGVPSVRGLFVGSSYDWWPPLAQELGIAERCVFTGSVTNVADYLAAMDVAVYPPYAEPFGLAILEGMAAGRAVVATRAGGIPEFVEHEVNGLLVEPRRPDQIAAAVLRLLNDEDLRQALAAAARRTALEIFTRDRAMDAVEAVYWQSRRPQAE